MSRKAKAARLAGHAKDIASKVQSTVVDKAEELRASRPGSALDERVRRARRPKRGQDSAYDATRREQADRRLRDAHDDFAEPEREQTTARPAEDAPEPSARPADASPSPAAFAAGTDLESLTKKELLAHASRLDVTGRSRMNKAGLVEALRATGRI